MAETTNTAHKNTKQASGPMKTTICAKKGTCAATGITAFCKHDGKEAGEKGGTGKSEGGEKHALHTKPAKSAAGKPLHPVAASKPGGSSPPGEQRSARPKKDPPRRQGMPPPKPGPKPLVLQVVPTPREEPEEGKKGLSAKVPHGEVSKGVVKVGLVEHVTATGEPDEVTIKVEKVGGDPNCPKWTIKDHGTGQSAAVISHEVGKKTLVLPFHPPALADYKRYLSGHTFFGMGWLDVLKPRHYTVVCESPFPPTSAHQASGHPPPPPGQSHTLEVYVYPCDKWTVKLTTEEDGFKPPWEKNLEAAKEKLEALVHDITELASIGFKFVPEVTIKLMEGELALSNFWEEEEGSNLVHWKAELEGKVTFIDLDLKFNIDPNKFVKAAEKFSRVAKEAVKDAEKFADFLKKETGASAKASLYIVVKITALLNGKGSWEKDEAGKLTPHLEELKVELTAGLGLGGEIELDHQKGNQTEVLVKFSGEGTSEMTLATSPRLGDSGNLLLDNKYTWKPLTVKLTAQVNPKPKNQPDKTSLPGKVTQAAPGLPELNWSWSGDLFTEIKDRPLPSLNLTTRQWEGAPPTEQTPLPVIRHPLPSLKPAAKPVPKPVPVPQGMKG